MRRKHEPLELPTKFDHDLGARLMMARQAAGLSRVELAALVNSTDVEIEAWELGQIVVYNDELVKLCVALKIEPNFLLGWGRQ